MILPPLLSDGEAEIPLLSAVLLPLLCGFGARGSEYQIRGSECDVRHVRSQDSLVRSHECWFRSEKSLIRSSEYQFRSGDFFETHQSLFTINEGFFRKPTSPPLPLREGPPLSPSPFPLRGQGMCQPPYSVLKPLRYKVGGPSEVSPAAELHFAVCDRMDTNRLRAAERPRSP